MKKRIVTGIMIMITCFMSYAYAFSEEITSETVPVVEVASYANDFSIQRLEYFIDYEIDNYTLDELNNKIIKQKNIQTKAHTLAENARALGWPETSETIQMAKSEWANAQLAINTYQTKYDQKQEELKVVQLEENKKAEYPVATEIWLYMKNLGWNDYICAGIMGNIMTETGGQTLDVKYNIYGDGYYGICQWNKAYDEIWGANLKSQCDFLRDTIKYEIDTFGHTYQKGFNFNSFLNLSNEEDAAKAFAKCYERCSSSSYSIRQKSATVAYNYFVNN